MTWEFLLTSLLIVVTPGTGSLFTVTTALVRGTRTGLVAAFGCTLGTLPHLAAAITGLAALLHASGVAFAIVKYLGVAYLLYLAWMTWRASAHITLDTSAPQQSAARVITSGVTLNLLNPKLTLFFVAFLPQFATTSASMAWLGGVFTVMTLVVFAAYAVAAGAARDRVLTQPSLMRRIQRVFAGAFAALAVRVAVAER